MQAVEIVIIILTYRQKQAIIIVQSTEMGCLDYSEIHQTGGEKCQPRGSDQSQFNPQCGKNIIMRHIPGSGDSLLSESGQPAGI